MISSIKPLLFIILFTLQLDSFSAFLLTKSSFLRRNFAFKSVAVESDYGAQSITVLEGLDPVRKRPGMYIGNTGHRGLHHLVFEVVDNSVDEALAGHCDEIIISLNNDGSVEVQDNGRGIPCEIHPTTGKSSLETVLCVLHAGGKFGGKDSGYKVSGGLHGVGVSVVNALSEHLAVEIIRDGAIHNMEFQCGLCTSPMAITPLSKDTSRENTKGTKIRFLPDKSIFKSTTEFDFDRLASRFDELAYLNAGLTLKLQDKRVKSSSNQPIPPSLSPSSLSPLSPSSLSPSLPSLPSRVEVYRHDGGIGEMVETLCDEKENLDPENKVMIVADSKNGVTVEVALRWSKDMYNDRLKGFANGIGTPDGGTHLDGMKTAVTRTVNTLARKAGKLKVGSSSIPGDFIREGLTGVISVKVPDPEFEGQTKTRLGNPEVRQIVDSIVSEALTTQFDWNPQLLSAIVSKAMDAMSASAAARAARDMVRRKSVMTSTVLPGKLADCACRDARKTEVYLVEGDSAAGSAKQGRDRATQAILPLRGKILNIERVATDKIYQNTELQNLISALGLGMRGREFDPSQLRYHKVIIMTDADVDGAHIRVLLLTFLYRYQREIIENGYVYIACPPLYKVTSKGKTGKVEYLYDQDALDKYLLTLPSEANPQIQRFKGLGEMMPKQLWETTMDPTKRILKQVSVEDASDADKLFSILMGDNVARRKDFIVSNAESLDLGDLDF